MTLTRRALAAAGVFVLAVVTSMSAPAAYAAIKAATGYSWGTEPTAVKTSQTVSFVPGKSATHYAYARCLKTDGTLTAWTDANLGTLTAGTSKSFTLGACDNVATGSTRYEVQLTTTFGTPSSTSASELTWTDPAFDPKAPTASFTADPLKGTIPLTVKLTDTSTGSPTAWAWDLGDGRTLSGQGPHDVVYEKTGDFVVKLTASNSAGSTSASQTITATAASSSTACGGTVDTACFTRPASPLPVPPPICTTAAPCVMEHSRLGSAAAAVPLIALVLMGSMQTVLALRR